MATALLTRPWSKVSVDADTAAAAAEVGTVCLLILHANTFPPPPLLDVVGFMLTMPVPGSAMHVSFQKFSFRKRERERERERERRFRMYMETPGFRYGPRKETCIII